MIELTKRLQLRSYYMYLRYFTEILSVWITNLRMYEKYFQPNIGRKKNKNIQKYTFLQKRVPIECQALIKINKPTFGNACN